MGGARLGHKVIGAVGRVGKKVLKGAAIGGALLVGASYHIGNKEMTRQTSNQARIRSEAEAEIESRKKPPAPPPLPDLTGAGGYMKRIKRAAPPLPTFSGVGGYNKKVVPQPKHSDNFLIGEGQKTQKDPALGVGEMRPAMDDIDLAMVMAEKGGAAAAGFQKGQKTGGLMGKFKKSKP